MVCSNCPVYTKQLVWRGLCLVLVKIFYKYFLNSFFLFVFNIVGRSARGKGWTSADWLWSLKIHLKDSSYTWVNRRTHGKSEVSFERGPRFNSLKVGLVSTRCWFQDSKFTKGDFQTIFRQRLRQSPWKP